MRFDLEIPPLNLTSVVYIREGDNISSSAVPLYYLSADYKDKLPSDFISIEQKYNKHIFISGGYEKFTGPSIEYKGTKFLLTNIAKYSEKMGVKIPLFYRFKIEDRVFNEAIKIVDYFGIEVSKDDYLVQQIDSYSYIYMNKENKILFIEYATQNKSIRKMLNLEPVFKEAGWTDLDERSNVLNNRYILSDGIIITSHLEELYISYLNEVSIVRTALGNLEDPWFIGVIGGSFKSTYQYNIPEYYEQVKTTDSKFKLIEDKKCSKVYGKYIKSQYNIQITEFNHLYVYIYDFYTKELKSVHTTNKALKGIIYKDAIRYKTILDYTNDGYIELSVQLEEDDVAYATHLTEEEYYEYKYLDLSSSSSSGNFYYVLYVKPNITTGRSVFHAKIGRRNPEDTSVDYFDTYEKYESYIATKKYYHLTSVNIRNTDINNFTEVIDVRKYGISILDRFKLCNMSPDILYYDIINKNITIPTNDTVIAYIDTERLIEEGKLVFDSSTNKFDTNSINIINRMYNFVEKTLNVSTHMVLGISIK